EHARRVLVCFEHADRLARLHEHRLVVAEAFERGHDGVVALPVARRLADAAVDDELLGALGHFRIEIVHEHPQRRFLLPSAGGDRGAARRADHTRLIGDRGHGGILSRVEPAETTRLEAFSDGIFAIAITLLILEVRAPGARDAGELWRALAAQWPSYVGYALSF